MSISDPAPSPADTPAHALGPAWDLLDALPEVVAPATMTSTTVEMVAAAARKNRPRRGWLLPVVAVAAAFGTGLVAGRATVGEPERALFDNLPLVEHFDVVREAGSVAFLEAVARRGYPPPRKFAFGRPGESGPPPYEALDAAVAAFAAEPADPPADRRATVAARPEAERRRLMESAAELGRLDPARRRDFIRLARAFGGRDGDGPDRDELLAAARLWHQWLATRDPAERKDVVALDTAERLEWLDRYALPRPARGAPARDGPFREGQFRGPPPPDRPRFTGRPPAEPRREPPPPPETPAPPR